MIRVRQFFKHAAALCRAPIAFFGAYAAIAGYLLAPHPAPLPGLVCAVGVFVLAGGASALNQYQERHIDARMERTRHRPLPSRVITSFQALFIALSLIIVGLALLHFGAGTTPFLLGLTAILWYNGFYTYLKRVTAFAAVPGAVVGMVPPAIGWSAAGGDLTDPRLPIICVLFFMWQVPHFWLQVLHHGEEYERAGLPALTQVFGKNQLSRIAFSWICSVVTASLLLPLYGNLTSPVLFCPLLVAAVWLIIQSSGLVTGRRSPTLLLSSFRRLNIFIFIVMSLLSADMIFFHLP
jgi:protoheme IX farnesyltransferase